MSTPEVSQDPNRFALLADILHEIEIGTRNPTELSPAVDGLELSDSTDTELSARELEVLRYLPTMLTSSEIAAELYVSVNTVKAHMRSIYRKLGVSRRQTAVVRAYEYGILRPRSSMRSSVDPEADSRSYDDHS
jgi:LuxR family maltose regulon positive regulatory protein